MNKPYTEKERSSVVNRYLNGEKISDISQKTNISRGTIYAWIKQRQESFGEKEIPNYRDLHFLSQKCNRQKDMIDILRASDCSVNSPLRDKFNAITKLSAKYNINLLCEALQVAKGSYYNHILRNKNGNTTYSAKRTRMTPLIKELYDNSNQIFGAGKIHAILKDRGYAISESTVAKIMHQNGWFSIRSGAKKLYLLQNERRKNILNQHFTVSRPNEVWVSDITYFFFHNQPIYTCVIIDLFARKVIAYKISKHNSTQLTTSTLKLAIENRHPTKSLLFHSGQGSNYTSGQFRKLLKSYSIQQSFSNPGTPYDNSVMESFFGGFKREELYRHEYTSIKSFRESVDKYMSFYNNERPHSILSNRTPNSYESEYFSNSKEKQEC